MNWTVSTRPDRRRATTGALAWAMWLLATSALWSVAAPPALAVVAPSATTGAAQQVRFASATVTGAIDPQGSPTTYYFQYGPTVAYGRQTSAAPAGSGTASVVVSQPLSGLTASTTYHYRVVAASAGGTVAGRDASFTTTRTPAPLASTGAASSVSTTTAVVSGEVNPEGIATSYYFQYGPTAAYGRQTPVAPAGSGTVSASVSQPLGGLAAATTYHYRIVAASAGGTVVGRDATFATTRTPVPIAVTGAATAVTATAAVLGGTVDPRGIATSYYLQYGPKALSSRTATAAAGAGTGAVAVSMPVSGLVPGTAYVYRLVAVGAGTATGATRSFTTAKIPAGLSLRAAANPVLAGASATFNGTLSGTGVGVRAVALQIERYPYTAGFQQVGNAELTRPSGAFSFTVASLTANTRVRAVTVGGSPSLVSGAILEQAVVRVSVHLHRHGRAARFSGLVAPAGTPVEIRIQRHIARGWVTIARVAPYATATGQAAYTRAIGRPHRGRYRVVAHVLDGSLLTGRSRAVTLR
jgi:hypothetical protein